MGAEMVQHAENFMFSDAERTFHDAEHTFTNGKHTFHIREHRLHRETGENVSRRPIT